ncbi:DUF4397 domain-containing protein [Haloarculaceae archaeon H-GB2-1]|nr:DUF4397 domain-containing protein [Haloarculaceae archaeon H-GB2-1]
MVSARLQQRTRTTAVLLASILVLGTALGGVAFSAAAQEEDGNANVRLAHASPDAGQVDVFVDDEMVVDNATVGYVSDYLSLSEGDHEVILRSPDGEEVLFRQDVEVEANTNYTAVVTGEAAEGTDTPLNITVVSDDVPELEDDESAVRLIHASPDTGNVTVSVESFEAAEGGEEMTETPLARRPKPR